MGTSSMIQAPPATSAFPTDKVLIGVISAVLGWVVRSMFVAAFAKAVEASMDAKVTAIYKRLEEMDSERRRQHDDNLREFEALRADIDEAMGRRRLPNHGRRHEDDER